ncbi:MAG: methylmalonyl-CoA mutase [Candidatus Schekmanbacteria bacterium RBG_16_38_10]|uniref:Methylmalonyl-CoA mutase n=1 Tax=Candidatus Schekmanbacteria bacterium RBG_16_38_10 TaxID=1817879 RepID=A0A1F7RRT0_9BACT|nr:MAG: methylmalonyl-CoA mutase [Candidatus Schekmanbacteria bacterium RBG_16_38_10]
MSNVKKEAKPEPDREFTTVSNLPINPLYTLSDLNGFDYEKELGLPGEFPYTRGIYKNMYRGRLWTMRQFAGFGTAEDTNQRYKYLLKHGTTGLSVAFHIPTLLGYDSDNPKSAGEVGRCGVVVDSLRDMEMLFDGIPLEKVTTSMTINAPAAVLLAMYIAVAQKQGANLKNISGTIQNDILKEYIAQKTYIYPPKPSMRIITDILCFCTKNVPKWNTISISGYHIREAGSTAAQELAFTIADGIEYINAGIRSGLGVDEFAPRLSFFFNAHNDFFEEIAKYRAARRMWAEIMRDRFGAKDNRSAALRFHAQTAGCSLTASQPDNNIVRVALQALAAVAGGAQSLHTNSKDETLALPTEDAVQLAVRTQQIIAYESGIINTADPFGGSYFVESLTKKLEDIAMDYIDRIDRIGGMVEAIESGFPQKEIQESSYWYQKAVQKGEKVIVGVNKFQTKEGLPVNILKIDEATEKKQVDSLKNLKKERNNKDVLASLKKIKAAAIGADNLMFPIIEAVNAYASLGEICDVLREVFGEYKEPVMF